MTQEEKARRYDEAIEISKKWRNAPNVNKIPTFANRVIEEIFPELKESEDERIREKLIDTFNFYDPAMNSPFLLGIDKKDIIAWLEKQGEQKLTNSYCQEHCKGFQETGKCFADGDCKAKTIAETVHAGTENILEELADRIEKAEIVNTKQVLEWIKEQTKE